MQQNELCKFTMTSIGGNHWYSGGWGCCWGTVTNWKNGLKETWKFNKGNCKVLHLCWKYPMQLNKLETTTHRKAAWKKMARDAGGLKVECESAVHSCGGRTQCLLGYIGKSSGRSLREVILPYYWALWDQTWSIGSSLGLPGIWMIMAHWSKSTEGLSRWVGAWSIWYRRGSWGK